MKNALFTAINAANAATLNAKSSAHDFAAVFVLADVATATVTRARSLLVAKLTSEAGALFVAEALTAALLVAVQDGTFKAYTEGKAKGAKVPAPAAISAYVQIRREAEAASHPFTIGKSGGSDNPCFVPKSASEANGKSAAAKTSRKTKNSAKRAPDTTLSAEFKRILAALGMDGDERAQARMIADRITSRAEEFAAWLASTPATGKTRRAAARPSVANLH